MNDKLKNLTEEKKAELIASIASKATQELFANTKSATEEETGKFKVIISTSDIDRSGESVNQIGWDLTFYKMNPIVLWAHDYSALPIGMATSVDVVDGKLVAEGKFAPASANPFAQQVRKLYELGMINATSVGFIPKEFDRDSGIINKSELLEFSFVPVPANAHALRLDTIKKLNLDLGMLQTKGISVKEQEVGSDCEIDGKPGVLQSDPNNSEGALVCVAKEVKQPEPTPAVTNEDVLKAINTLTEIVKATSEKVEKAIALGQQADGDKGAEGEKGADNERSKDSQGDIKDLNKFIETRNLVRIIDNSAEKILRIFNEDARKHSVK